MAGSFDPLKFDRGRNAGDGCAEFIGAAEIVAGAADEERGGAELGKVAGAQLVGFGGGM